ncbi:MAG TPA: DUF2778 domain-containing protein [Bosea sp. (in: a-proteobacteria)]|uniref:DUF2778 domain-containing protein n=1 Tax=Bosea sp. (in: a-proteobacteria) TaxID=1871050 RepID=UPI002E0F487D|nr:DUF2778 domain-containing protein [Bosea sp. (in: a-proteobacteria)]
MRYSNRSTGYAYSLGRRRRSGPFLRLAMLFTVGGAAAAGVSLWQGKNDENAGAHNAPTQIARALPVKAAAPASVAALPVLRPGYVAGYVARPMAESRPLAGGFQSANPAPKLAVLDPETTGSIAPSTVSSPAVAAILPPVPPAAEPEQKIALISPLPVPRPSDLKLPSVPEPRAAARGASRRSKDVAAAAEPPVDNRSFLEKIFGARTPTTGTQLAYAAPQDDISGRRGSGLTVAPEPAPAPSPMASPMSVGPKTAVYDISARTLYLPNGERLVANSGLGEKMNDLRYVHVRMHGPTPPHVYTLTEREALFHGVRAIRMHPVGGAGKIFGRTGLLVHSYLLGPRGDSNGCVSVKDYDRFLQAFLRGEITRLVVVPGRG